MFALALIFASPVSAQIMFGEMGFQISGINGTAGDACWGFSCTPQPLAVQNGETLTLTVRAPLGAPYAIVAGFSATSCLRVPGIWNALVLDPPLLALFGGSVSQLNQTRFCYDGYEILNLSIPNNIPVATTLALQAVAVIGTPPQPSAGFGLSSAITLVTR